MANKRIPEFPAGVAVSGDFLLFYDTVNNVTKKTLADNFFPGLTNQNFEWQNSPSSYDEDEIVTWGGNIYQSLIDDNEGIVPGSDELSWEQLDKATNLSLWSAGVFTEADVFTFREIGTETFLYRLVSAVRPYNSTDIVTEIVAGDWKLVGATLNTNIDSSAAIVLDFSGLDKSIFNLEDVINGNRVLTFDNDEAATHFVAMPEFSGEYYIQFPVGTLIGDARYDPATYRWYPIGDFGKYKMEGWKIGGIWVVEFGQKL